MGLFADIPSSPLSSAPSDLASRSPSPEPVKRSNVGRKRKVAEAAPTHTRATRRKTADDFSTQLTEIREQIILPKVKKAAARKSSDKEDVAAAKTHDKAEEITEIQNDASTGVDNEPVDVETPQLETDITEPVVEFAPIPLPGTENVRLGEDKEHELPLGNGLEHGDGNEVETIGHTKTDSIENKAEAASELQAIPAVVQKTESMTDEAQQQVEDREPNTEVKESMTDEAQQQAEDSDSNKKVEKKPVQVTAEQETKSPTPQECRPSDDEKEDELAVNKIDESLQAKATADESTITARPSRRRVAPTKLADDYPSPIKTITATSKRKSQQVRGNWSAEHLLTNPKSKLATCNLPELLSQERAWTLLSRSDQLELISMLPPFIRANLPDEFPTDMEIPNILRQAMRSNNSFQADVRFFQEDLAAGRYDPQWQKDAQKAMDKRAAGVFDSWKEQNREEFWGQKQKVDWQALSGDSAQYTLGDLAKAGLFEIGDVWALRVSRSGMVVDKEAKLIDITPDFSLCFSFPPGQHKFSASSNGEDIGVEGIKAPKTLCDTILKEDGRLATVRVANAWRDFRCTRRHQDMGSLFDVRELYHSRQSD